MKSKTNKHKQNPWFFFYRRLKRFCINPESLLYDSYGGLGIKFEFENAEEVKALWDRDNAAEMSEPYLVRKNRKKHFNKDNCCFIEFNEAIQKQRRELKENGNIS